jgi:hypothetical protein
MRPPQRQRSRSLDHGRGLLGIGHAQGRPDLARDAPADLGSVDSGGHLLVDDLQRRADQHEDPGSALRPFALGTQLDSLRL